jgi:hypothetical protein
LTQGKAVKSSILIIALYPYSKRFSFPVFIPDYFGRHISRHFRILALRLPAVLLQCDIQRVHPIVHPGVFVEKFHGYVVQIKFCDLRSSGIREFKLRVIRQTANARQRKTYGIRQ